MNIITMPQYAERAESLEYIIREGAAIGSLSMWRYRSGREWEVHIDFVTSRGTEIKVHSENENLAFAIVDCINQAREYGTK